MGIALYVVLEEEQENFDVLMNGKALAITQRAMDRIAKSVGVRPLSDFVSSNPDDVMELLGDGDFEIELPEEAWFEAGEGLKTVRALLNYSKQRSNVHEMTIEDLERLEEVLSEAEKRCVKWHLAMDF